MGRPTGTPVGNPHGGGFKELSGAPLYTPYIYNPVALSRDPAGAIETAHGRPRDTVGSNGITRVPMRCTTGTHGTSRYTVGSYRDFPVETRQQAQKK